MSWEQRQRRRLARRTAPNPGLVHAHPGPLDPQPLGMESGIKIATWNIRSVTGKRPQLEMFLRDEHVAVLALQETARPRDGWQLRVRGYHAFETPAVPGQQGQRGLALLVREDLGAYQVGDLDCPYMVAVKAARSDGTDLYIASVYVPPQAGPNRNIALRAIRKAAEKWMRGAPDSQVMLLGDWNMTQLQLDQRLARWRTSVPLRVRACRGSSLSFFGSRRWTDIDHIVASPACALGRPTVHRTWDLSDHWPLGAWLRVPAVEGQQEVTRPGAGTVGRFRLDKLRDPEVAGIVAHHNIWDTLFLDEDEPAAEALAGVAAVGAGADAEAADADGDAEADADGDADVVFDDHAHAYRDHAHAFFDLCAQGSGVPLADAEGNLGADLDADAVAADTNAIVDADPTGDSIQTCVAEFERAARIVAEDMELLEQNGPRREASKSSYRLTGRARRAINQRRKRHMEWEMFEGPERGRLWERYELARRNAKKAIRDSMQRSWSNFVRLGAEKLAANQMHEYWLWARRLSGRTRAGGNSGSVILDSELNRVVTEPQAVIRAWARHYGSLAADVTGHSRDLALWVERYRDVPEQDALPGMDAAVSWAELNGALTRLSNWKAPGADGIPGEFYKTAAQKVDDPEYDGVNPSSALGRMLLRVTDRVLRTGQIPDQWQKALVVSIPKKGDPKLMDNYRGISLIPVVLKLATTVAIRRVQRGLEERHWFRKEQAGFRFREECPAHAIALHDIVQRRAAAGHGTYLAFVDMRKAYDTVPHGALLRKLWLAGVRGRVYQFFEALYWGARMAVLTKHGCSDAVPVLRGVRQGCPASPTIFNVFVNDILDRCEAERLGVAVPGLQSRVTGLLFADDLVIMAPTRGKLVRMLQLLNEWAEVNEMSFNSAKCGVMGIGKPQWHTKLQRNPERWQLGGERIPIVDEYTYLGLVFNPSLDLKALVEDRVRKGWKAFHTLKPVLASNSIPLVMRLRLIQYCLVPVLSWGSELWGMSGVRCAAVGKVLNAALRSLVRMSERSRLVSPVVLGREVGISPLEARAAGARARAFFKYPTLRTVIAELMANPAGWAVMARTWQSQTRRWLATHGPQVVANNLGPHGAAELVRNHVWARIQTQRGGRSTRLYLDQGLDMSTDYIHAAAQFPQHAVGVHWLTRARVGGVWTGRGFESIRWLPEEFRIQCPFCDGAREGETLVHLLVECSRWVAERVVLQPLVDEARARLGPGASSGNVATYLLGGRLRRGRGPDIWCRYWVRVPRDLQMGVRGFVFEPEDRVPGFVLVARFFEAVMPTRLALLGALLNPPRADAPWG